MKQGTRKTVRRGATALGLLLVLSAGFASLAPAEGYPRQVAVAPFVSYAQDNIAMTVAVLPRLLSSRLMALAGAEVLLLPAGVKDPVAAAQDAHFPLLLQGTVSKLGKGYSIDVTATDLGTGKTAGAFFVAAATEDEIIPKLGELAGDIVEKLFGVKPPVRAAAQAAPPAPAPAVLPAAPAPVAPVGQAVPPAAASAAPAAPPAAREGGIPATFRKIAQSEAVADELVGVVAAGPAAGGAAEVVAYGRRTLYFYRIEGDRILPAARITKPNNYHFLNVEWFDVDGDGGKELVVTNMVNDRVESFLLKRRGDRFEEAAQGLPYFLVVLRDWMGGAMLAGQRRGIDTPFSGRIHRMVWDGKTLKEGAELPANTNIAPLSAGILGLSSARFGTEWRYVYTDDMERLRIVAADGRSLYRSKEKYGSAADFFEWGDVNPLVGRRPRYYLRDAARVVSWLAGGPFLLIPAVKRGVVDTAIGSFDSSRLVLLQWDAGVLVERAATQASDRFYSGVDILPAEGAAGGKVVCSVIEQESGFGKEPASRLLLFALE